MLSADTPCAGVGAWGTLRSEVKEEPRRRPAGDTSGEEAPESPCPPLACPHTPSTRKIRDPATERAKTRTRPQPRLSRSGSVPRKSAKSHKKARECMTGGPFCDPVLAASRGEPRLCGRGDTIRTCDP